MSLLIIRFWSQTGCIYACIRSTQISTSTTCTFSVLKMPQLRDCNYYSTTFQRAEKLLFSVILHFAKTAGGWYRRSGFCLHATCEIFEFFSTPFSHALRVHWFFYKNSPKILSPFSLLFLNSSRTIINLSKIINKFVIMGKISARSKKTKKNQRMTRYNERKRRNLQAAEHNRRFLQGRYQFRSQWYGSRSVYGENSSCAVCT